MTPRVASGYRAGLRSSTNAAASADFVTDISYTEYGSAACTLGVASDNTVFVAPAFTVDGIGVLRSSDFGKSWRASVPEGVQQSRNRPVSVLRRRRRATVSARRTIRRGAAPPAANGLHPRSQ
ncbi:MAG: hypothetical protein U5N21_02905 [Rhodococcus sp. (in: high G+C Gram-positive bacteria)]|nr:hypothetical protein [Rhodococcus sp. (in: high G+C Gram-positive bacteria)]